MSRYALCLDKLPSFDYTSRSRKQKGYQERGGGKCRHADQREACLQKVCGACGKGYSGGMVCRSKAEAHDANPPGMADRREAMP